MSMRSVGVTMVVVMMMAVVVAWMRKGLFVN